jgi:hypothetical protein
VGRGNRQISRQHGLATLFDLAGRGQIEIEEVGEKKWYPSNEFSVTLLKQLGRRHQPPLEQARQVAVAEVRDNNPLRVQNPTRPRQFVVELLGRDVSRGLARLGFGLLGC